MYAFTIDLFENLTIFPLTWILNAIESSLQINQYYMDTFRNDLDNIIETVMTRGSTNVQTISSILNIRKTFAIYTCLRRFKS